MTRLIYKDKQPVFLSEALIEKEDLWIPIAKLTELTGLELKPEGVCFDDTCVSLSKQESLYVKQIENLFNITAFSHLMGYSIVHNKKHDLWVVGEGGTTHRGNRNSLKAPDFTLPDLNGKQHSLSAYLGHKILLVSWASW